MAQELQVTITRESAPLPTEGYVRLPQILAVIPVGKSTWWNGVRSGRFPSPVKLGPRTTAWKVEDIRQLVNDACDKQSSGKRGE